jgi:glycosyltransferase involved in cell wall biosynthesis
MKIGIIIPTRGRTQFLKNALRMIEAQTLKPNFIEIVDDLPISDKKDICWRYKLGYERLKDKCDVILFWEDDDFYNTDYIRIMTKGWEAYGKPILFGISTTTYYHLRTRKYATMTHPERSSMFCSLIKGGENISFGNESDIFVDIFLWKHYDGKLFDPGRICLGIKHAIGLTGGIGHKHDWKGYDNEDRNDMFLKSIVDAKSYEFYTGLYR